MNTITKSDFIALVGDAYDCDAVDYYKDKYGISKYPRKATLKAETSVLEELIEYFHDEDMLLEEWLHCQRQHIPFIIYEEDDNGNELVFQIRTGEELYHYFMHMKKEFEDGVRRYRY